MSLISHGKQLRFLPLLLLAVVLLLGDKTLSAAPEQEPVRDYFSEEGFRLSTANVLTLYGKKDPDVGMVFQLMFSSMSPDCRGMFATDTGDTNFVSKSGATDKRGTAGKIFYLLEGEDHYSIDLPLQLEHPQCQWELYDLYMNPLGTFTKNPYVPYRRGGGTLMHWGFLLTEHVLEGATVDKERFPEKIEVQCYNVLYSGNKRGVYCNAPGWSVNNSFPSSLTETPQTIEMPILLDKQVQYFKDLPPEVKPR